MKNSILVAILALAITGCAESPLGRKQLTLLPDSTVEQMGAQSFVEMKKQTPTDGGDRANQYVHCVAQAIVAELPEPYASRQWEVVLFRDDKAVNAFALPGGKIGVYTGMLKVAETADQLASVVGHEVGHVMARHGNERLSQQFATAQALAVLEAGLGATDTKSRQTIALLGLGAQVGVLLPFSRIHETEADEIGLDLMARAGFNPQAAVQLWNNMERASKGQPPEFLSTHPSHESRINKLTAHQPAAVAVYEQARAAGKRPACVPPPAGK